MAESAQFWIDKIQENLTNKPELAGSINAVYQFDISGDNGGKWILDLTSAPGAIKEGEADSADCTIIMAEADFVAMMDKTANPMSLYATQKLKVQGNLPLSLKLMEILK